MPFMLFMVDGFKVICTHRHARLKHKLQRELELPREVLSAEEGPITNGPTTLDARRIIEGRTRVIEDTAIEQIKGVHA